MTPSPEIENIIERAIESASSRNHEYVTIEHLLLSLITHKPFKVCLAGMQVDVDLMKESFTKNLNKEILWFSKPLKIIELIL